MAVGKKTNTFYGNGRSPLKCHPWFRGRGKPPCRHRGTGGGTRHKGFDTSPMRCSGADGRIRQAERIRVRGVAPVAACNDFVLRTVCHGWNTFGLYSPNHGQYPTTTADNLEFGIRQTWEVYFTGVEGYVVCAWVIYPSPTDTSHLLMGSRPPHGVDPHQENGHHIRQSFPGKYNRYLKVSPVYLIRTACRWLRPGAS